MGIQQEYLTWELMDYWRRQPGELAPYHLWAEPLYVYRRSYKIIGFGAMWNLMLQGKMYPQLLLFGDSPIVSFKLLNIMDESLRNMNMPGYFCLTRKKEVANVLRKLHYSEVKSDIPSDIWTFARVFVQHRVPQQELANMRALPGVH